MNSFWMPKKQPLYAPMLSTFGGGSARGFNPGGGGGGEPFQGFSISTNTVGPTYSSSEITNNINAITTNSGLYADSGKYSFTITQTGVYRLTVKGSRGAPGPNSHPAYGRGGYVQANFNLSVNDKITVLLGQEGKAYYATMHNGGGGGATYVILNDAVSTVYDPLIIAGGGMGCQSQNNAHTGFAAIADGGWTSSTYYRSNDVPWSSSLNGTASGWNDAHIWYMGGSGNANNFEENKLYGGGGCGGTLLDDGADRDDSAGSRGRSYISGGNGGVHPDFGGAAAGGYGSGASSRGWSSGGGGGGWIGGASRNYGKDEDHGANGGYTNLKHGGASYVNSSGSSVTTEQGNNNSMGSFEITQVS